MFVLHSLRAEELLHQAIAEVHHRATNRNIAVAHRAIAVVVAVVVLIAVAVVAHHEDLRSAEAVVHIQEVVPTRVEEIHEVDSCSTI